MIRGEGTEVIQGVTLKEVVDFVLDPAQYTKADTKIIWVTKIADTPDGMIGLEEGRFFGFKGSVVSRYRWTPDMKHIEVTLVHGMLKSLNATFDFVEAGGGVKIHHVEEIEMAGGPFGRLFEIAVARSWLERSVPQEVREIKRLMEAGERGKGP